MAEVQASLVSSVPVYRGGFAGRGLRDERKGGGRNGRKNAGKAAPLPKSKEQVAAPNPSDAGTRRAYNREYMRLWRKRNQERDRVYNREYQRKRHFERKIARILKATAEKRDLCGYGCGRAAVETVERIDPRTWRSVQIRYCGHC